MTYYCILTYKIIHISVNFRTARTPQLKSSVLSDYVTCPDCEASFKVEDYRAHFRRCTNLSAPSLRSIVQLGKRTFYHCHPEASEHLRLRISSTMRNDKIVRAIRYDRVIMRYGSDLVLRLRDKKDNKNISTQLRRLGRLKLLLKVKNLSDCLHSDYSEEVSMIEKMASDPSDPNVLLYPTVAQNVTGLVKAVTETFKHLAVKDHDEVLKEVANIFLFTFSRNYYIRPSGHAGQTLKTNKRHKEKILPSQESIQTLIKYLEDIMKVNYLHLTKDFDKQAYMAPLEATVTCIQVKNRKRPKDVERVTLKDYENIKEISSSTSRAFSSLTPKLQDVVKEYPILYTQGKLGKDVKMLVSRDIRLCIEMLLHHRSKIDIPSNNIYLFA